MARKILILGGTRYFGKRLVQLLLENGDKVTVATRGQKEDPFGAQIERIVFPDRDDEIGFKAAFAGQHWDIVYDQIAFSSSEAEVSCQTFADKTDRYIFTSTQSVYYEAGEVTEDAFKPQGYPIKMATRQNSPYGEGKRAAEAVFFQHGKFPVSAVRYPIVLGPDDYTGRLEKHIQYVREQKPLVIENLGAKMSLITSADAGRFLFWLGQQKHEGPINACSDASISIGEVLGMIERVLDKKALVRATGEDADRSPFVEARSKFMNNSRARALGYRFEVMGEWLPKLIQGLA